MDAVKELTDNKNGLYSQAGYYLFGKGQKQLSNKLSCNLKTKFDTKRINKQLYFLTLITVILLFICIADFIIGFKSSMTFILFIAFLLPCIFSIGKTIADSLVAKHFSNCFVPSISEDATNSLNMIIAIPCLIGNIEKCKQMIKKIEMCKLSNPSCTYALVCDFKLNDNKAIATFVSYLTNKICQLNKKYDGNFAFIARDITIDNKIMPKERKRGALVELCNIAVGKENNISYWCGIEYLKNKKYIFTIDEDTVLSPGVAQKLYCAIEHPMNQHNDGSINMFQPFVIAGIPYKSSTRFAK